jgi:hypothetical protein
MARKHSASDLAAKAIGLIEQIEEAKVAEVREFLAERLMHLASPKGQQNLSDCHNDPEFDPSADFLAGLRFAAELVADENFDY